jgi:sporulation protein YlmC with PRC-barrel domain
MTPVVTVAGRIIGGCHVDGSRTELVAAAALGGEPVINAVGEELGRIQDLLIDLLKGRIAYAVVELTGVEGMNDKLLAVPWVALTLDADNGRVILNIDKRRLKHAPCFDPNCWPTHARSEWAEEIHRFYSAEPFWHYHA